jgi:hypothetical protein
MKCALAALVIACSSPSATPAISNHAAATSAPAPSLSSKLLSQRFANPAFMDSVFRDRAKQTNFGDVGALVRGDVLEVTVLRASPDRIAQAQRMMALPVVKLANPSGATFALDSTSLVRTYLAFDPTTTREMLIIELAPAQKDALASFTAQPGTYTLTADGLELTHATVEHAIDGGKLAITLAGADPAHDEEEAARLIFWMEAARAARNPT